jgi:hypothetical protein
MVDLDNLCDHTNMNIYRATTITFGDWTQDRLLAHRMDSRLQQFHLFFTCQVRTYKSIKPDGRIFHLSEKDICVLFVIYWSKFYKVKANFWRAEAWAWWQNALFLIIQNWMKVSLSRYLFKIILFGIFLLSWSRPTSKLSYGSPEMFLMLVELFWWISSFYLLILTSKLTDLFFLAIGLSNQIGGKTHKVCGRITCASDLLLRMRLYNFSL